LTPRGLLRTVHRDWRRNHRHHGGLAAVTRCLLGTAIVGLGATKREAGAGVESLTFSVIPQLTRSWLRTARSAWGPSVSRSVVGDCSGGLGFQRETAENDAVETVPLLNIHHGAKLDLFLRKRCSARFVLVCDDDVFWRDASPLLWALEALEQDEKVLVASLMPRKQISSVLKGRLEEPMGSDCLLIRRAAWLEQELSFKVLWPNPEEGYDWCYDTGDWAHLEMLRRGFKVAIAPQAMRRRLLAFEGISSWLLRFQDTAPDSLEQSLKGFPERHPKALRTLFLAAAMERAGCDILVSSRALERARNVLRNLVPEERAEALCRQEQPRLDALTELLIAAKGTVPED
jgi:hypothetical protein